MTTFSYFNKLRNSSLPIVTHRKASSALIIALTVIFLLRRNKTVLKAERTLTEDVFPDVLPDIVNDITNRRLTKEDLAKATAKLYEVDEQDAKEENGKKRLLVPFRGSIKKVCLRSYNYVNSMPLI